MPVDENTIRRTRWLAAALALVVVFDVAWVGAPFLAVMAVPFALAAWRLRAARVPTRVGLIAWSVVYVAAGVSFAVSNGLHDGAGHDPTAWINPGDFAFAYLGTPLALLLIVELVTSSIRARRMTSGAATA